MDKRVRVSISEFQVAQAPTILVTYGLGSCLGITLHDPESQIGGLAHTLLPVPMSGLANSRRSKFVTTAISLMIDEMTDLGAGRERLNAKIIGGANMFENLPAAGDTGIGSRNAEAARQTLAQLNIPLLAEDVGGNYGRTVEFNVQTGQVLIRLVRFGETTL